MQLDPTQAIRMWDTEVLAGETSADYLNPIKTNIL